MNDDAPPPALCFARVLAYAVVDSSVEFTGRTTMYVDGKELGAVPRLALCQNIDAEDEIVLFHCDESWNVLAAGGTATTLQDAKADAAISYRGIDRKWIDTGLSEQDARRWLERTFPDSMCSFCGKLPIEFSSLVRGHRAGICDHCVRKFFATL